MQKYMIYNSLISGLNPIAFMNGMEVLKNIKMFIEPIKAQNQDPGFQANRLNQKGYENYFLKIISLATNHDIIAVENSSYFGLNQIKNKYKIKNSIIHINNILLKNLNKFTIKQDLHNFNIGIYEGCFKSNSTTRLLEELNANIIPLEFSKKNCGYFIKYLDPVLSFKMAGEILFEAFDKGCDFLIINDITAFHMFDTNQKKIEKIMGRKLHGFEIYSPCEILLLAMGEPKKKIISKHFAKNID